MKVFQAKGGQGVLSLFIQLTQESWASKRHCVAQRRETFFRTSSQNVGSEVKKRKKYTDGGHNAEGKHYVTERIPAIGN